MAKPKSNRQFSLESAHLHDDAAGIADDHWSRLFFEHIFCTFDDGQFADMYEEGGRYPISPAFLAALTILQYMFRVSDRQAVENTIMRRDWRIALGIRPDYDGFCATVLVRFRQRLEAHGRAYQLFASVLQRAGELGMLGDRRRLRVDATHLLANVAYLSRAENIQEAIRIVVCDLYDSYPELHQRPDFLRLHDAYGEEVWVGCGGSSSERKLSDLGRDGFALLELCSERPAKGKEVLNQILQENFICSENDEPKPRGPQQLPKDRILSPHEPDVRRGKKRNKSWLGDKVHLVETAEPGQTNLVVDVMVTDPRVEDSTVTQELAQRSRFIMPQAEMLIADGGYSSAANSRAVAALGLELISPPRPNTSGKQIPASDFEFDFKRRVARCPEGHESVYWKPSGRNIRIHFDAATCRACPRWGECTTNKRGRYLGVSRAYEQLVLDRQRAGQPRFAQLYCLRSPIEASISELVHCCGLRRSRYRSGPKRALHAILAATALNVRRLLRCLASGNTPKEGLACIFLSLLQAALSRAYKPIGATQRRIRAHQRQLSQIAFSHT